MNTVLARLLPGHAADAAAAREQKEQRDLQQVTFPDLTWDRQVQAIVLSAAAGAIGAFVSVLQRMASDKSFPVHYDLGKRVLYMLGSYRPVLGVVFGVFTYFVLASEALGTSQPDDATSLYYYGSLAFVAGFNERFARVLAKNVAGLVPAQGAADESDSSARSDVGEEGSAGAAPTS